MRVGDDDTDRQSVTKKGTERLYPKPCPAAFGVSLLQLQIHFAMCARALAFWRQLCGATRPFFAKGKRMA